jgi:hypothetical protein
MTNETENENYSALIRRLQKLERDNRRMKRVGALVLVATAALIFMGQNSKNRALDADSLVLRDASGRVRIELGIGDDNTPILRMFGSDNKPSIALSGDEKGSGLWFFGGHGKGMVMLSNVDGPTLILSDGTGGTSVDVASVHTYDNDKFNAFLGRANTVNPQTGATTKTSAASLILFGKDGKSIYQVP